MWVSINLKFLAYNLLKNKIKKEDNFPLFHIVVYDAINILKGVRRAYGWDRDDNTGAGVKLHRVSLTPTPK